MEQEDVQNVTEEKVTENTETQTAEEKVEKTFATQEDFNEALKKEVARKTRNLPSKEDLKAFNEWKESQKTETEKSLEKDKKIETLEKQLAYAENKSVVANAGVDAKFQKFVLSEVSEMEGEFEDNLKDYLKENPQFLISKVETPKTNGVATKKIGNEAESGVTAILKAKHPDIDF